VTDENERTLEITLNFLKPNKSYIAEIYEDATDADWKSNPLAIKIHKIMPVNNQTTLHLILAPGGGTAIRFRMMSE